MGETDNGMASYDNAKTGSSAVYGVQIPKQVRNDMLSNFRHDAVPLLCMMLCHVRICSRRILDLRLGLIFINSLF